MIKSAPYALSTHLDRIEKCAEIRNKIILTKASLVLKNSPTIRFY